MFYYRFAVSRACSTIVTHINCVSAHERFVDSMHKIKYRYNHIRSFFVSISFLSYVICSSVPPTVPSLSLLSSLKDTNSINAQLSNSYAPYFTICTSKSLVRPANYETEYVSERKKQAQGPLSVFLSRFSSMNMTNLLEESPITIGISLSGGGYRAMLSGAGVLAALDERTRGSETHLGGLLQSSTYIAGNSGGLWLVANNLLNDGAPICDAIRKQSFASPLIEGVPDVPISQLRTALDARSFDSLNGSLWKSYNMFLNQTDPEKGTLTSALLDTFFKTKDIEKVSDVNSTLSQTRRNLNFYKDLNIEVRAKKKAGFHVSLIDYWGRAVSKKIFPQGKKSVDICMSSVTELSSFGNYSQLFPIFGSVERLPGVSEHSIDSHLFEFNPFEFGSWDSFLNSFVDIRFLGSELINGFSVIKTKNEDYSVCISGYDNMGLITGTSSGLFNTVFHYVYKIIIQMEDQCSSLLSMILRVFGITNHPKPDDFLHPEYALYSPNPFKGISPSAVRGRQISEAPSLLLADGGDDGQNIPFHPMLVKGRNLEVIFAFDATSDHENFPNGTTLMQTARRYHSWNSSLRLPLFLHGGTSRRIFPSVPSQKWFVEQNMGSHPLFLGCDLSRDYPIVEELVSANLSEMYHKKQMHSAFSSLILFNSTTRKQEFELWDDYVPPLIIYLANYNHSYASNTSTFRSVYSESEVSAMLQNGYNVATYKNNTEYMSCVACAILKRKTESSQKWSKYSSDCEPCFQKYCFVSPN